MRPAELFHLLLRVPIMAIAVLFLGMDLVRATPEKVPALDPETPPPTEEQLIGRLPPQKAFVEADLLLPFPIGETITYNITWGVIPVGQSVASTEWVEVAGRRMILIRLRTRSNSTLDKLYPINDTIESLIDPETFLPVRFTKILNEGRYKTDEVTLFDHARGIGYWTHNLRPRQKTFAIGPDTRDLVSFMYHMRGTPFAENEKRNFEVMADEKLYELVVQTKKTEKVKLKNHGKVDSLRLDPEASFNGIFVRKGRMTLWLSKDARRLCTKIEAETPFANAKLHLLEVTGPGEDSWTKPKKK